MQEEQTHGSAAIKCKLLLLITLNINVRFHYVRSDVFLVYITRGSGIDRKIYFSI